MRLISKEDHARNLRKLRKKYDEINPELTQGKSMSSMQYF